MSGFVLPTYWRLVKIDRLCKPVERINPKIMGEGRFRYIDISSVDNDRKMIADIQEIENQDAPSRARQLIAYNDVLVSTVRPNLNAVALVHQELGAAICSTGFCVLRPNIDLVEPEYLFAWVRHPEFIQRLVRLARGIGYPAVSDRDVGIVKIPVPPISEQRRIVDILRQADDLRCLRREVDARMENLQAALFYEMFGEPITNEKGWPKEKFDRICNLVRGSSPRPKGDLRYFGGLVPRLMIADLKRDGVYVTPMIDSLTEEGAKRSRPMKAGSVVMAVSGAPGLPAILKVNACIHDGLVGFRKLSKSIKPEYLVGVLLAFKTRSEARAIGATFQNLKTDQIKKWYIPIPPIELQEEYTSRFKKILKLREQHRESTKYLASLFQSLLARAFTGELTTVWREQHAAQLHDEAIQRDIALGVRPARPRLLDFESGLITQAEKEEFARRMQEAVAPAAERLAQTVSSTFQLSDVLKIEPMIDLGKLIAPLSEYQAVVNTTIYEGLKQVSESALESLAKSIEPIQTLAQSVIESHQRQMLELAETISQWAALATRRPDKDHSRYHSLQELGDEQYLFYLDATRRFERYFTIEDLCEGDDDWEPEFARRSLALLEALGLVVRVSVLPPTDEEASNYITVYRAAQPDDDSRTTDLNRLEEKYPELRV